MLNQFKNHNKAIIGEGGYNYESDEEIRMQNHDKHNDDFVLLDKMSKRVKLTNCDVNKVIYSLNHYMNKQLMSGGDETLNSDFIEKLLQEFDFIPKN